MAAFRLIGIDAQGGDLDLSELQFWAQGQRVDAGASISCSLPPVVGDISSLIDGNPATGCRWAASDVRAPGFWIQVDLAGERVDEVYVGGALLPWRMTVVRPHANQTYTAWPALVSGGAWFRDSVNALAPILSATPAGAWGLDGAGATQADLVGSRTGTRTGGVNSSTVITGGLSGSFDPQTTGLVVIPALGLDAGDFSVVIDVQTNSTANLVIAEHGSNNQGWSLQTSSADQTQYGAVPGGVIVACGLGSGGGLSISTKSIADNRPHRILFTYSAQKGRFLYIDGVLDSRDYGGYSRPTFNTSELHVGSRNGDYGLPAGTLLSAFAIFNRALSAAEVAAISIDPRVTRSQSMQRHRPLSVLGPSPVLQGLQATSAHRTRKLIDVECGGQGRIYGTVARKNTPANVPLRRRVRLHRSVDGYLARETWSKADGSYEFREISTRYEWDVIAWDHELQEYSTVANNQLAEVA
ncbi:LamG-like jellyroll fold domain-containing protein [Comamonas sp. AG1104]|uniref:LamG-like jellyroll fold domain-containing protein n=1 Tax=Comamonas sp. AG1104 TaxID=2183900 RepID=UPI000E2B645A|nr:LamG-like jellyroll fold domain-containing protein [Comamonas sp. AG1104]RDI10557.1 concanavalin A-like lectin/glucanase superfamily protein [Comamonas sp. AG1104]